MSVLDHRGICVGIYASQNKFPGTKQIFLKIRVIEIHHWRTSQRFVFYLTQLIRAGWPHTPIF
jgi:hypothetical protein